VLGEVVVRIVNVIAERGDDAVAAEAEGIVKSAFKAVPPKADDLFVPGKVVFIVRGSSTFLCSVQIPS
jgi:hypothetical protein